MSCNNHFEQNRPVHLAMRNIYYQKASQVLIAAEASILPEARIEFYEKILAHLRIARQHGRFAVRARHEHDKDCEFFSFLDLMVGNIKAVLAMINQKESIEKAQGFFFSFLGENNESVEMQAAEYERRANDIIRSLHKTIELAQDPFKKLIKENLEEASERDQERYKRACDHYSKSILPDEYTQDIDTEDDLLKVDL